VYLSIKRIMPPVAKEQKRYSTLTPIESKWNCWL
jgi:hypothetical protein